MVSGNTVTGDLGTLTTSLNKYSSEISGLSGSWQGSSYDNISSKADAFTSEYTSTISGQMNAFASACNLYSEYIQTKQSYNAAINSYNQADASGNSTSMYTAGNNAATLKAKLTDLKGQIEGYLRTASSGKLEASKLSMDTSLVGSVSTSTFAIGKNPNLLYSTANPGYVFPFAKGVNARVSSPVGKRKPPTAGASTNHSGTDIAAAMGTEIYAIHSGTIVQAGRKNAYGYGNLVKIQQDDGLIVTYGHVSKSDFYNVGDRVEAGDLIALVGSEGVSTGPHLHLQINDSNKNVYDSQKILADCWPS